MGWQRACLCCIPWQLWIAECRFHECKPFTAIWTCPQVKTLFFLEENQGIHIASINLLNDKQSCPRCWDNSGLLVLIKHASVLESLHLCILQLPRTDAWMRSLREACRSEGWGGWAEDIILWETTESDPGINKRFAFTGKESLFIAQQHFLSETQVRILSLGWKTGTLGTQRYFYVLHRQTLPMKFLTYLQERRLCTWRVLWRGGYDKGFTMFSCK